MPWPLLLFSKKKIALATEAARMKKMITLLTFILIDTYPAGTTY
jgi:hypothetical protein